MLQKLLIVLKQFHHTAHLMLEGEWLYVHSHQACTMFFLDLVLFRSVIRTLLRDDCLTHRCIMSPTYTQQLHHSYITVHELSNLVHIRTIHIFAPTAVWFPAWETNSSPLLNIHSSTGVHPTAYSVDSLGSFLGGKAARALSWAFTTMQW
jgi:hypothetical protein